MVAKTRDPLFSFQRAPKHQLLGVRAFADIPDGLPRPERQTTSYFVGDIYPCPIEFPHPACTQDGKPCRGWHGWVCTPHLPGRPEVETFGHGTRNAAALELWRRRRSWAHELLARSAGLIPDETLWESDAAWAGQQVHAIGVAGGDVRQAWEWLLHNRFMQGDQMAALDQLGNSIGKIDDILRFTTQFGITIYGQAVTRRNVCGASVHVDDLGEYLIHQSFDRGLHKPGAVRHQIAFQRPPNVLHETWLLDDSGCAWQLGWDGGAAVAWRKS